MLNNYLNQMVLSSFEAFEMAMDDDSITLIMNDTGFINFNEIHNDLRNDIDDPDFIVEIKEKISQERHTNIDGLLQKGTFSINCIGINRFSEESICTSMILVQGNEFGYISTINNFENNKTEEWQKMINHCNYTASILLNMGFELSTRLNSLSSYLGALVTYSYLFEEANYQIYDDFLDKVETAASQNNISIDKAIAYAKRYDIEDIIDMNEKDRDNLILLMISDLKKAS